MTRQGLQPIQGERIILVKGIAGLGNRLQSVATALIYAKLTGRRMIIDWRDPFYSDDGQNVFNRFFALPDAGRIQDLEGPLSVAPKVWERRLDETAMDLMRRLAPLGRLDPAAWRRFTIDPGCIDHPEDVVVYWSPFEQVDAMRRRFTGCDLAPWRRENTRTILRRIFREDIDLDCSIGERVESFRRTHFRSPVIGVHVRYSDRKSRLPAISRRLQRTLKRLPEAVVFLATDNLEVQGSFQSEFPRVVVTQKWFPPAGGTLHRPYQTPSRMENGMEALVDLYLLGCCDYLIIDEHSSFGVVASLISGIPWSRVYNVQLIRAVPVRIRRMIWYYKRRIEPVTGLKRHGWGEGSLWWTDKIGRRG